MVRYERIELSSQLWKSHIITIILIPLLTRYYIPNEKLVNIYYYQSLQAWYFGVPGLAEEQPCLARNDFFLLVLPDLPVTLTPA